jgi:tetratricopeptide (TPR) repeat protein
MQPEAARLFKEGCRRAAAGRWRGAIRAFEACLALAPLWGEAQYGLGVSLWRAGLSAEALAALRAAANCAGAEPEWFLHLALALEECGEVGAAFHALKRGMERWPGERGASLVRCAAQMTGRRGELAESVRLWKRAADLNRADVAAANNLAMALMKAGRQREALGRFIRLAAREDCPPLVHSNALLCSLLVPGLSGRRIFVMHREWAARHEPGMPEKRARPACGRIRVGYVAPSFANHSVAYFMRPVLANIDHSRFEVYCYSEWGAPETGRAEWRDISTLTATEAAARITRDRIHILVDLAGHALGNRMDVFALRPAPVQCTYLGHAATTGLDNVGYCFTDSNADPPGMTESLHSEQLIRLDPCFVAYRPPPDAPEPQRARGAPFTFGCFGGLHKINTPLLRLWAAILSRVPGARLLLKGQAFGDAETTARLKRRLERLGVNPERVVTLAYKDTRAGHLASYGEVDVALDTFPYAGTTTTCEALWMGVPVVTLAGRTHVSRLGVSLLGQAGLWNWIARGEQQYIQIAVAAARKPNSTRARAGLRRRLEQSPLRDERGLCRRLEKAYREIA